MQALSKQEQQQIQEILEQNLSFFVKRHDYNSASIPLLTNTYNLWRQFAYDKITKLPIYAEKRKAIDYIFYLHSENSLLVKFIEPFLKKQNEVTSNEKNMEMPPNIKLDYEKFIEYKKTLYLNAIYEELFMDILKLPYLKGVFSIQKTYYLSPTYRPKLLFVEENEEAVEKVSQNIIKKGFGTIAQKMFTRTFIIQASTIAVKLNPFAMVASFAFSELIDLYKKQKKQSKLSQQLEVAVQHNTYGIQVLKQKYCECINLLGMGLKKGNEQMNEFLAKFKKVVQEDWLIVKETIDEEEWKVVELGDGFQGDYPTI